MKRVLLLVMMLCSICFTQTRRSVDRNDDFYPIYRIGIPTVSTIIVYKAFKYEDMDLDDKFKLLLTSVGVSLGTSIIHEMVDSRDFRLKHAGEYSMGMFLGGSLVLLWEF